MKPAVEARVFGKWILAGEHAVLRGCPALVFPVYGKFLRVSYFDEDRPLQAEFRGENGGELNLLFWGVVERALDLLGRSRSQVGGRIEVESSIPVGAGLGASAALCVGVGRWLTWKGLVKDDELYEFSRQLENLFHGESSGVDIAVVLSGKGLHFERSGVRREIQPNWNPRWYISYSGKRGVTSECVARVKRLWESDQTLAEKIDQDMFAAVNLSEKALLTRDESSGFDDLRAAIDLAYSCFERWGLAGGETALHIRHLLSAGAVAAKPTGSGDGGYVLSLWRSTPPAELSSILIPLTPPPENVRV